MEFSRFDHECMALAMRLAARGLYTTDPNPNVGCVIADREAVLAQGWHRRAGGPHAEIDALGKAGSSASGATAYITLEPCSFRGRTGPCADALVEAGISRVVYAAGDPNPRVDGAGADRLRAAGIEVAGGLMKEASEQLNPGFFKRMRDGRPLVRVKTAISLDGRTALQNGSSKWITSAESRDDVQRWRARSSAILTGIGTVLADDPRMTARVDADVRQPIRVVADSRWRTPAGSKIVSGDSGTLIFGLAEYGPPDDLAGSGAECVPVSGDGGRVSMPELLRELTRREINEVQVEAGSLLCGALLEQDLVDEVLVYQAPLLLGDGGAGPFAFGPLESMSGRTHLEVLETIRLGQDIRIRLQPQKRHSSCSPE